LNRDRIPAVTTALLAPVQALVTSSSTATTTTSPGSGTASGLLNQVNQASTSQVDQGGGWLYHLLIKAGVSHDTASTVTDLIVRPLSILLVVVVAALVARYGAKFIRRLLTRVADKTAARSGSTRAGARVTTMSSLAANVWRLFVFVIAGAIVLGMLGINLTPLLASATIIGATLGFGAQQIVRDYFSGALMTMEDQYNIGDSVTVGDVTGVIEDVTMRLTRFRGIDGTLYVIPNGDIRLIGNLSRGWARAVCDLTLPGAAAADLDTVRAVIGDAAHEVAQRPEFAGHATEPPQVVGLLAADSTTITMRVMLLTIPSLRDPLTRALREAAIEALARAELWPADPADPAAPATPPAPAR
jgi:small conductance mechanosensitive channel